MKRISLTFILFLSSLLTAQHSDPYIHPFQMGIMNGNNLFISFYDDGHIADFRQGIDIRGLWKGNYYIGDLIPLLGIELPIKDYTGDGVNDTIHSVIIPRGPRRGQSILYEGHPTKNYFWGWNPVPGYRNPVTESPALSNNPSTWPAEWPDHPEYGSNTWNGLFGKDVFIFDLESYFVVDDFWDTEANMKYGFFPNYADTSITGHGIKMSVRYLQMSNVLMEDIMYRVYDIKNTSKHTYSKMVFGNVTGSLSGGDGDSGDDLAEYDQDVDVVMSYDYDGIGNVGQKTGVLGETILESQVDNRIKSFSFFNQAISPDLSDDEGLWERMLPGKFPQVPPLPQDGDHMLSSGYFSLEPGETKRLVLAIIMGDTKDEVKKKAAIAEAAWYNNFDFNQMLNAISFTYPVSYTKLSGSREIKWAAAQSGGTVDLFFSSDAGESWSKLAGGIPDSGSFMWNTGSVNDCAFGMLSIIARDAQENIYGYKESNYFAVDNSMNGKPFFKIISSAPDIYQGSVITDEAVNFSMLAGDADDSQLTLSLYYSGDNGKNFNLVNQLSISSGSETQIIPAYINSVPNSEYAVIKFVISDGVNSAADSTKTFSKQNPRDEVHEEYLERLSGQSSVSIIVNKVDKSAMNGHEYLLTFDDTTSASEKYYSIYDLTENKKVIDDALLNSGQESQMFDGLTFIANDIITEMDSSRTQWNVQNQFGISIKSMKPYYNMAYDHCADYRIVFYDSVVDTSADLTKLIPSMRKFTAQPVNFEVYNISNGAKVKSGYSKSGAITSNLSIVLLEDISGKEKITWNISLVSLQANQHPAAGDTAYIFTSKGLSFYDAVKIRSIPVSVHEDGDELSGYSLSQNYPNPFNAATKIKYSLPEQNPVEIIVYDILGRKVGTIVNEIKQAGVHEVSFDASGLTSGVYIYSIKSGGFSESRKFVLLK